jgi:hypothetical protein
MLNTHEVLLWDESEQNCMNTLFQTFGSQLTANTVSVSAIPSDQGMGKLFSMLSQPVRTITDALQRVNTIICQNDHTLAATSLVTLLAQFRHFYYEVRVLVMGP